MYELKTRGVLAKFLFCDLLQQWDRRLKRLEEMKLLEANGAKTIEQPELETNTKPEVEVKAPLARTPDRRFRLTGECGLARQIDGSGEFDHYSTGRDLAILGLPLAVQLRGEMLVVRMRHRLWADSRGLIRGDSGVELF